jgi:hypothetical protein
MVDEFNDEMNKYFPTLHKSGPEWRSLMYTSTLWVLGRDVAALILKADGEAYSLIAERMNLPIVGTKSASAFPAWKSATRAVKFDIFTQVYAKYLLKAIRNAEAGGNMELGREGRSFFDRILIQTPFTDEEASIWTNFQYEGPPEGLWGHTIYDSLIGLDNESVTEHMKKIFEDHYQTELDRNVLASLKRGLIDDNKRPGELSLDEQCMLWLLVHRPHVYDPVASVEYEQEDPMYKLYLQSLQYIGLPEYIPVEDLRVIARYIRRKKPTESEKENLKTIMDRYFPESEAMISVGRLYPILMEVEEFSKRSERVIAGLNWEKVEERSRDRVEFFVDLPVVEDAAEDAAAVRHVTLVKPESTSGNPVETVKPEPTSVPLVGAERRDIVLTNLQNRFPTLDVSTVSDAFGATGHGGQASKVLQRIQEYKRTFERLSEAEIADVVLRNKPEQEERVLSGMNAAKK